MFSLLYVALFALFALSTHSYPFSRPAFNAEPTFTNDCADPTPSSVAPSSSPAPSSSVAPSVTPSSSSSSSASAVPSLALAASVDAVSGGPFTGGIATYFYQNGNAGACGQVHSDYDYICAMDQTRFGTSGPSSPLCGKEVQITNTNTGQSITVTIADDCPTCENENSIDLSVGAFQALSDLSAGEFPISWSYVA